MLVLVTGGAGFIGSHSVEVLLSQGAAVRVLDNLSSGKLANIASFRSQIEFVEGDIRDLDCVAHSMKDVTHVLHLAAQVSVPESVKAPLHSNSVNISGFLNIMDTARLAGIQKMVYASSAAVYGTPVLLPLSENSTAAPLSPYGLEKLINDQYAALYSQLYGFSSLGMRYFNVYGPRQDPSSAYSGVISKFAEWAMNRQDFTVFGDGLQTRDFVFVGDVARANASALSSPAQGVINIATGNSVTLLELAGAFEASAGHQIGVKHGPAREGDVPHSSVKPELMKSLLAIQDTVLLPEGLQRLMDYLRSH